jgi:hypothetical protein
MKHIIVVNSPDGPVMAYVKDTEDQARALREKISSMGIWGQGSNLSTVRSRVDW